MSGPTRTATWAASMARNGATGAPPTAPRQRLERRRNRTNGVAALSRLVPIFLAGGRTELPTLSTQRGFVPRSAVQHRIVCAVDADGGAGLRPEAGHVRAHVRRPAPLRQSSRAGATAAHARAASAAANEARPGRGEHP